MRLKDLKKLAAKPIDFYDSRGFVVVNDDAIVTDYFYLDPFIMIVKIKETENEDE